MEEKTSNNKKLAFKLTSVVVLMFGFAFAMVPLYDVFCEVTGLNGKTGGQVSVDEGSSSTKADEEVREIKVQFLAMNNENAQVDFGPVQSSVVVKPGEVTEVYYKAVNLTNSIMTTQSVPSVSPLQAAEFLKKIECFCFKNQTLAVGEEKLMPLRFYIDKELPEEITKISLNYTIFDITEVKEGDEPVHQEHSTHQS